MEEMKEIAGMEEIINFTYNIMKLYQIKIKEFDDFATLTMNLNHNYVRYDRLFINYNYKDNIIELDNLKYKNIVVNKSAIFIEKNNMKIIKNRKNLTNITKINYDLNIIFKYDKNNKISKGYFEKNTYDNRLYKSINYQLYKVSDILEYDYKYINNYIYIFIIKSIYYNKNNKETNYYKYLLKYKKINSINYKFIIFI